MRGYSMALRPALLAGIWALCVFGAGVSAPSLCLAASPAAEGARGGTNGESLPQDEAAIRNAAQAFVDAYPDARLTVRGEADGYYLVAGPDTRFLYRDKTACPAALPDAAEDAPLCATVRQPYPAGPGGRRPASGFEPGRVRNEAFFKFLYGGGQQAVEEHLVPVTFLGETWRFSSRHGAAAALQRVAARLERAAEKDPTITAYILPGGGTYAWRNIAKSPRLSAHSFGICIDLNIEKGLYWQWNPAPGTVAATRRDYPQSIVDAFEAEGFIWGGKWHSFDFMHFEYRPELFPKKTPPQAE